MSVQTDIDFVVGEGAVRDLLLRSGIDPAEIGSAHFHRIKDVRLYQGMAKVEKIDPESGETYQEMEVQDMASVVLSPAWEEGPEWELVSPGPVPAFQLPKPKTGKPKGMQKAVIIPDMQIGYYRTPDGLVSTHDERAIQLAWQIVEDVQPDLVVLVGDNLDLPEFGKYRTTPAFAQTTQAAIDYCTQIMYELRLRAPKARIVWLAGNHEERMPNYTLDNASAAYGLKQGKHPKVVADTSHPVLSVPHLCQLDVSNIEYLPGYPANRFYINDRLRVIHGNKVKSRGSTAQAYLGDEKMSVIFGHIHRREYEAQTFEKWDGETEIMAASPGCLAKVNGAVPSTKGGTDLDGRPLTVIEDWQQGIAIVDFETEDSHWFNYDQVAFVNYRAKAEGKFYSG